MRALGLGPKLVAACGAAFALVLSLSLPWYGKVPATLPKADPGLIGGSDSWERVSAAIPRLLGENAGSTAWDLPGPWAMALSGLGVLAVVAVALCLVPAVEHAGRGLLQLLAFGVVGAVLFKLLVRPDGLEPRFGLFASLFCACALVLSSQSVAGAKLRRRPDRVRRYAGTAPPPAYDTGVSVAPPVYTSPQQF